LLGDDVAVVPRENPAAFADSVIAALGASGRTQAATIDTLERKFRSKAVAVRFYEVYRKALGAARP
jgi:hypothetical protein